MCQRTAVGWRPGDRPALEVRTHEHIAPPGMQLLRILSVRDPAFQFETGPPHTQQLHAYSDTGRIQQRFEKITRGMASSNSDDTAQRLESRRTDRQHRSSIPICNTMAGNMMAGNAPADCAFK